MHTKAKESEADFCKFLGLMVARVLMNNRLGQFSHNFDIFVSLFDILHDKGILGIAPQDELLKNMSELNWNGLPNLFDHSEDSLV